MNEGRCASCGTPCRDVDRFCSQCGRRDPLKSDDPTLAVASQPATTPVDELARAHDPLELAPGTVFARRYRIDRLLGEGGMGRVYLAVDNTIHEQIALKVLSGTFRSNPAVLDQFKRELKLARKVRHRNVVASFHLGESNGRSYITQEYIEADNLSTFMEHQGPLGEAEALRLLRQVLRGLKAAHDLGIVHRDIKASNILVNRDGMAFITDFGLATSAAHSAELQVAGTPRYMAPELFERAPATPASDLYACGVLLFLMLTGRYPLAGQEYTDLSHAHLAQTPDPIPDDVRTSPATRNLYAHLLAKRPKDRPHTAAEALDVIDGVLALDALRITPDRPVALVADADDSSRRAAADTLGRQGYHVETLTTADELVTRAFALTPALIVLSATVEGAEIIALSRADVALAGSEPATEHRALSVCRLLRQDGRLKAVPILVIAGSPRPGITSAFRLMGASEVLVKPFTPEALAAGVQRARQRSLGEGEEG